MTRILRRWWHRLFGHAGGMDAAVLAYTETGPHRLVSFHYQCWCGTAFDWTRDDGATLWH